MCNKLTINNAHLVIRNNLTKITGLFLLSSSFSIIANELIADGKIHRINATGQAIEYSIPANIGKYQYLEITTKGGDGGKSYSCFFTCKTVGGGTGATLTAIYPVDTHNTNTLTQGDRIRFIIGQKGEDDNNKYGYGGGGGGGGTGVLLSNHNSWDLMLVAGAGGGAFTSDFAGQTGKSGEAASMNGTSGKGGGGHGGSDGNGGQSYQNWSNVAGGGGGAYSDGADHDKEGEQDYATSDKVRGKLGYPNGDRGGDHGSKGGWGFGGGGASRSNLTGAGGGGGYSGGGGGEDYFGGGGGGSWPTVVTNQADIKVSIQVIYRANANSGGSVATTSPEHGFIEYRFVDFFAGVNLNRTHNNEAVIHVPKPKFLNGTDVVHNKIDRQKEFLVETEQDTHIDTKPLPNSIPPGSSLSIENSVTLTNGQVIKSAPYYIGVPMPFYMSVENSGQHFFTIDTNTYSDIGTQKGALEDVAELGLFYLVPERSMADSYCIKDGDYVSVQMQHNGQLWHWYTGEYSYVNNYYKIIAVNSTKPYARDAHFQLTNLTNPEGCTISGDKIQLKNHANGFITVNQYGQLKTSKARTDPHPDDYGAQITLHSVPTTTQETDALNPFELDIAWAGYGTSSNSIELKVTAENKTVTFTPHHLKDDIYYLRLSNALAFEQCNSESTGMQIHEIVNLVRNENQPNHLQWDFSQARVRYTEYPSLRNQWSTFDDAYFQLEGNDISSFHAWFINQDDAMHGFYAEKDMNDNWERYCPTD
ncbi:hypothetical protein [Shewanella surugensis]|uniref:Uncharacterized protein n=1 Tax=Shewanella surugensis TaxID=212020 RepID=A0ABT0LFE4_9GAMM|nr:hypothetical protein [Shewanella surugensis]MCL1125871.1 hypothetical protein [Shewanella surugensis]